MNVEVITLEFSLGGAPLTIELTADQRGLSACLFSPVSLQAPPHLPALGYLQEAQDALRAYFSGDLTALQTRLAPDGTPFQQAVWRATMQIPPGEVRSYSWLAAAVGNPLATRAVAQALGANPLMLFVPCHRVVRSDMTLGGFSAGLPWKVRLLAHEGASHHVAPVPQPRPASGTPTFF